jgi:hypothetical protein
MDSAVWAAFGVLVGVLLTGLFNLRAETMRANRAEKLDRWKRLDDRLLARDEFQRQTMLDLQDTIRQLVELEVPMVTGQHRPAAWFKALNSHGGLLWRMLALRSRVDDQRVRELVDEFAKAASELVKPGADTGNDPSPALAGEILDRTGELIRQRFEDPTGQR